MKAIKTIKKTDFDKSDTLVIFGEVFPGGYISGLIRSVQAKGMNIVYSTMGRRDPDGKLRKLNQEELSASTKALMNTQKTENLNASTTVSSAPLKPFINIPLEAGFDMEPSSPGPRPIDLCQEIKLKDWEHSSLDKNLMEDSREKALFSFKNRVREWLTQLEQILPKQGNVLIAHTMAGGVPRVKILLPVLNRVLKGSGKRFFSSKTFWDSDLGWLCQKNFNEVTAQTYKHLIELSTPLRDKLNKTGRKIFYTAYSYHGTKVLVGEKYHWQSYAPYLQGFAKLELEKISKEFFDTGVQSCAFNVPEILTKSSTVFPGVEIPLYTLLGALRKEGGEKGEKIVLSCLEKMKDKAFNTIMDTTKAYFESEEIKKQSVFEKWPQHNSPEHMEKMLNTSKTLATLHKDPSQSITPILSEVIFKSCGNLILQEMKQATPGHSTKQAFCWLGHDVIAADLRERQHI